MVRGWGTTRGYPTVAQYPRLLVDIDVDSDLDIVGVNTNGQIRYALNNGSGFDVSVLWVDGTSWDPLRDELFMIDLNKSGGPDIVHASGLVSTSVNQMR